MDEIEEANKAATESCHRVLDYLSRPSDQLKYGHLMGHTMDAVFKFKRVVSLLNSDLGHGRVRKMQKFQAPLPHYVFLDNANCRPDSISSHTQAFPGSNSQANPFHGMGVNSRNTLCPGNPTLDLNLNGKLPLQFFHEASSKQFQLLQHQKQQQNLQFQHLQMKQQSEMLFRRNNCGVNLSFDSSSSCTASVSSTRSFLSSLSIDASVANMDGNAFHLVGAQQLSDPSSHPLKRRCPVKGNDGSARCGSIGKCHCSKKRKHRVKRSIRVPAISNRLADIPSDDYSWRKYGQKPIKGSPHPRGYYKCSSARGCPARKHVERCLDDPSMLSITYESEHNHPRVAPLQLTNT